MEANKILSADILDIIFEGKNKNYGAYDLRKTYNARIKKALLVTGIVLALLLAFILIYAKTAGKKTVIESKEVVMAEAKKDAPPPPPVVPPPPPPPPPPPAIRSIQFTPPIVKKDNEIKQPKEIKEIDTTKAISTATNETTNTEQKVKEKVPETIKESKIIVDPVVKDEDKVFLAVENESEYPGGSKEFQKYLMKNLNVNTPTEGGATAAGNYTVIVRFVVRRDGAIEDVVAETDPGFGCGAEAVKIIKRSKNWIPGNQNGTKVSSVKRQPITFQVTDDQ